MLADEIIVIAEGRLLQAGPRSEVYNRPASPEVARLLGIENLCPGIVAAPGEIIAGSARITASTGELPAGTDVLWCIRPDRITIDDHDGYRAVVTDIADIGTVTLVTVLVDGGPELRIRTTGAAGLRTGDSCRLGMERAAITLWPARAQPSLQ